MILADTGPLIALFDRTDAAHGRCVLRRGHRYIAFEVMQ